jgi:hypothetical protein
MGNVGRHPRIHQWMYISKDNPLMDVVQIQGLFMYILYSWNILKKVWTKVYINFILNNISMLRFL